MRSLIYFIKEALRGFSRNLSTTLGSIVTIFLSLMIIGVFLVGGVVVENVMSSVENEITITAYVADDASQSDIDAVERTIRNMDGVANISFTTKEQALQNFQETSSPDFISALDGYNPLPASIDVELADPQMVESVAAQIIADPTFQSIADNPDDPSDSVKYGRETVQRLLELTNYVRIIGIVLIIILVFIALIFINNTIRLAILARRKEISIMRLVGASNGFIRGPFLMEGALNALIGSILAVIVIQVLRFTLIPMLQSRLAFLNFTVDGTTYVLISVALVVAGLVIGLIGSALAMRRYLKV